MINMKKIICSLFLLLFLVPSCVRRTTIPDDELALIFRDAFLVNAYVYDMKIKFDTMQVYQPIFDKYGYTSEDVAYTIGSFSKRKSARLGDVVERAIKLLEQGSKLYKAEAVIIDSIEQIALRRARRTIYHDSLVEYHSLADSARLKIVFDSLPAGSYTFKFNYLVDSIDNNRSSYRTMTWVEPTPTSGKKGLATSYLRKRADAKFERVVNYDTLTRNVHWMLAESFEVKRSPHVTFRDVTLEYIPHTTEAVEALYREKLDIRIFANDFFDAPLLKADSLELPAL